jgi:hypothetical protein
MVAMLTIMMLIIALVSLVGAGITGSGTVPSDRGRCSGYDGSSANGTSRHEEEEVECKPTDKEYSHRDAGDD